MKNNKAFTLVELLAVVAILTLIIVIITPKVFKQLKTAENVTDQEQINSLINTSKIYMNQNSNLLPQENDIYVISLDELKESGLIQKSQILNPSTNEELNGYIIVKFENNKYKYEYKEELEQITVTFDPQGGTLQETSKNVIPGEKYGTLPTPTREGYTFMGWRGKNMFDEETILMAIDGATHENGYYVFHPYKAHQLYSLDVGGISNDSLIFKPNVKYTLSYSAFTDYIPSIDKYQNLFISFNYTDSTRLNLNKNGTTEELKVATSSDYKTIDNVSMSYGRPNDGANAHVKYIQIEEGDTATEYEPYQEYTSSTTVTKEDNHTLYAIWKANE